MWSRTIPPRIPVTGITVFTRSFPLSDDPTIVDRQYETAIMSAISIPPRNVIITDSFDPTLSIYYIVDFISDRISGAEPFILLTDPRLSGINIIMNIASKIKTPRTIGMRIV